MQTNFKFPEYVRIALTTPEYEQIAQDIRTLLASQHVKTAILSSKNQQNTGYSTSTYVSEIITAPYTGMEQIPQLRSDAIFESLQGTNTQEVPGFPYGNYLNQAFLLSNLRYAGSLQAQIVSFNKRSEPQLTSSAIFVLENCEVFSKRDTVLTGLVTEQDGSPIYCYADNVGNIYHLSHTDMLNNFFIDKEQQFSRILRLLVYN